MFTESQAVTIIALLLVIVAAAISTPYRKIGQLAQLIWAWATAVKRYEIEASKLRSEIDRLGHLLKEQRMQFEATTATALRNNDIKYEVRIAELKKKVEERHAALDAIYEKLSRSRWSANHTGGRDTFYEIAFRFSPRIFDYGAPNRMDLEYLADYVTHQIKHEIVTSKFVRAAHETERRRQGYATSPDPYTNPFE